MSKKIKVAIMGLGSRGKDTYAPTAKAYADKMEIVAIADLIPEKVEAVAKEYGVPAEHCYASGEEMLEQERLADLMIIATQDKQHVGHAIPALRKGYHILLEKPVSPDIEQCREIVKVAEECQREVVVCHVLRYTPFYKTLKAILDEGKIGKVVSVMGLENVGYWHQAHSFVRGNWRNSETTSPMILAKCCHDMDLLLWLTDKTCDSVSSYGSNFLFKEECAPEGATKRCMDGCKAKDSCPYDAEKIYMTNEKTGVLHGKTDWPLDVLALYPNPENIMEAIKTGPYGRCVYFCDNNVVDHQVVNLNMTDGSTISFTMTGFTGTGTRYTKFMGTQGEIVADMSANLIHTTLFGKPTETTDVSELATDFSGHAGGDTRMVEEYLDMLLGGEAANGITSVAHSVESHYCALAAEESRLADGAVIKLDTLRK
ncbi:MAG: Gfo/Idh/MocA family oxidoreductase [Eubacteriales bacterium]